MILGLIFYSDGTTPQKQAEQILAVTPILRGQKSNEKNPIPPPHTRSESYTSNHAAPASENQQPQPSQGNDLIDFGQSDGTPSTNAATPIPAYQAPTDLQAAQTVNGGQQQKDLENALRSTSKERTNGGALIDFSDDLKRDLPTVDANGKKHAPLKREDTDTQSLVRTSIFEPRLPASASLRDGKHVNKSRQTFSEPEPPRLTRLQDEFVDAEG